MIKLLTDLPENVLGFSAHGLVTAQDYSNVLVPAVEATLAKRPKVRMLASFGPDFTGYTPSAMWDDAKLGLGHVGAWERVALVTDHAWLAAATQMFSVFMPGVVRVFSNAERDQAVAWLTENAAAKGG